MGSIHDSCPNLKMQGQVETPNTDVRTLTVFERRTFECLQRVMEPLWENLAVLGAYELHSLQKKQAIFHD